MKKGPESGSFNPPDRNRPITPQGVPPSEPHVEISPLGRPHQARRSFHEHISGAPAREQKEPLPSISRRPTPSEGTPREPSPSTPQESVASNAGSELDMPTPLSSAENGAPPGPPKKPKTTTLGEQEPLTPFQVLKRAQTQAREVITQRYPDEHVFEDDLVEGHIARDTAEHVIGMTRDSVALAQRWGELKPWAQAMILQDSNAPGETLRIVDNFTPLVECYQRKGHISQGQKFFHDDMDQDNRTTRIERAIPLGFKAALAELLPDLTAVEALLSTYGWFEGNYGIMIPSPDSFPTILPNTRLAQITHQQWKNNRFEERLALGVYTKHNVTPYNPREN